MKILAINASPRIGGNTDILTDKALEGARSEGVEIEKVVLTNYKFSPCLECEKINHDGTCLVGDDFQIIFEKIREADALIFASPIFFGSISAQAKMLIDRFQCAWTGEHIFKNQYFKKAKNGAFIAVEASNREDFFDNAKAIVKNLFAVIKVKYAQEIFVTGVDGKQDILKHPEVLKTAFELGQNLVLSSIKEAKNG
jgi:multimeric flavodoxin WrbA